MIFHRFFLPFFGCLLVSFWPPFEILVGVNFRCFFQSKNGVMFQSIFWRLLDGFWVPRPSKIKLSCTRDAHFRKITFFVLVSFFVEFWTPKASQNGPKIHQKIDQKINTILHWKKKPFYRKREPRWGPQGVPKREFWRSLGVSFSRPLPGTQNGCKMVSKWSQNGCKMGPKLT